MKIETYLPKPYTLTSVKKFTENTSLMRITCAMNPLPGQFFEVTVPNIGEAPLASCSYNKQYVDILLRNAGNVSGKLFEQKKGEPVWIRGPYGQGFPIDKLQGKNIIMIGVGTGIAPITSMIEYIEQHQKEFGQLWIYLGFKDEEHVLLEQRIKRWQKKFHVHIALSHDEDTHQYEKGHVQDIMQQHQPPIKETAALLCGPESMMEAVTDELHTFHMKSNNIYWSMERRMECAFGSCGRCLIQDLYCCKDGPVFRYDVIKPRLDNEASANEVEV